MIQEQYTNQHLRSEFEILHTLTNSQESKTCSPSDNMQPPQKPPTLGNPTKLQRGPRNNPTEYKQSNSAFQLQSALWKSAHLESIRKTSKVGRQYAKEGNLTLTGRGKKGNNCTPRSETRGKMRDKDGGRRDHEINVMVCDG